jgi:putative NADH-flavin reductase
MKIALFGATGMVGSRIASEATARGHEVTTFSRSTGGDLADAAVVRDAAANHDVLVSATGPSRTGDQHQPWLDAVSTLIDNAGDARVLFVGGAGSLLTPDGTRLLDTDGFPPEYHPEASSGAAALDLFRGAPDSVDWTFLSPSPVIAPGERTGSYAKALDTPAGDFISAEDYAVALVDEIEQPAHRRQRFTAASV